MTRKLLLGALLLSVVGGCDDRDTPPAKPPADTAVVLPDGMVAFLGECQADSDCADGRCVQLGQQKRCTRLCTDAAFCPQLTGWSCGADGVCQCTAQGKQPDVCGVDGDCDGQPDRVPHKESCNGEDDDCDGEVDDVSPGTAGATLSYHDADGDGFGDDNDTRWLCTKQQGWVERGGDCDDDRKQDNPDADEICGDTFDNDCDGFKEDTDQCGLTPIVVPDVTGSDMSASMKSCGAASSGDKGLDITEIVAKQDSTAIKFTVRLAGSPVTDSCVSYTLQLGDPAAAGFDVVYVYRPGVSHCTALAAQGAFLKGTAFSTQLDTGINVADPGHVSFTMPKTEFFPHLPAPTYKLRACANATADAAKDLTECGSDSCELLVHR